MAKSGFRTDPLPESGVVELAERILDAARRGKVRTLAAVVVDPVQRADVYIAGELNPIRANALLGGLTRAKSEVQKRSE
jgi:hypothetical protein